MATDNRPTDDAKPKRRGKAPTITLEASEVVQEPVMPAADPPPTPDTPGPADSLATASDPPAEAAAGTSPPGPVAETAAPAPAADRSQLVEPSAPEPDGTFREPSPRAMADAAPDLMPSARPAAPAAGPGFGRLAAAGLIGALLTGGLGVAAQIGGFLPGQNRDQARMLETRIADLDRAVKEVTSRPAPVPAPAPIVDLAPLNRRLETLDTARSAMETRIATLEQRPAAPAGSAAPGPVTPAADTDAVGREIEALKIAVEAIAAAQRSLAATASATAPAIPQQPARPIDTAAIDARIRAATAGQVERVAALEAGIPTLRREVEATAAAAKAAETRIAALDSARSQASGVGQRAALVVGIGALRAAVDRGGPFAQELRTAQALGLSAEAARSLTAAAERGLPTQAQIAQRFAALAPSLAKAAPAGSAPAGLFDRIAAGAQNLVRVRPIGEAAGDDVPTVVSRVETKLGRGDLAGALADFDKLAEPVRAIGASWAAEARARLAADEALRRLGADAVQSLTGG
jgi:hypothetical protein